MTGVLNKNQPIIISTDLSKVYAKFGVEVRAGDMYYFSSATLALSSVFNLTKSIFLLISDNILSTI